MWAGDWVPLTPANRVPRREISNVRALNEVADFVGGLAALRFVEVERRIDPDYPVRDGDQLELVVPGRWRGVAAEVTLDINGYCLVCAGWTFGNGNGWRFGRTLRGRRGLFLSTGNERERAQSEQCERDADPRRRTPQHRQIRFTSIQAELRRERQGTRSHKRLPETSVPSPVAP